MSGLLNLLADVMALQPDLDDPDEIEARTAGWSDQLEAGRSLTAEDEALLWRSPAARERYAEIQREISDKAMQPWRDRGYATEITAWAADSVDGDRTIHAAGFTLRVHPLGDGEWTVSVVLDPDALEAAPPKRGIRLTDSGGLVWIEGVLDGAGGLDAFWPAADESPVERLRHHTLLLKLS